MKDEELVDPAAEPGSYGAVKGGFVRLEELTLPAHPEYSRLAPDDARAVAKANLRIGFPVPPEIQQVIDADDAAKAEAKAAREAAKPAAQNSTPASASSPAADKKEA